MPLLQKPLGWLQRFLYNVEDGPIPGPQAVITVDHDWPLEARIVLATYNTIAGFVTTDLLTLSQENHALFFGLMLTGSGGTVATTDSIQMSVENFTPGQSWVPIRYSGFAAAVDNVPLIQAKMMGAAQVQMHGVDPQYMPPGSTLRISHGSVAGGLAVSLKGAVVVRPKSYPLRLP